MIDASDVFASEVREQVETCLTQAFSEYPDSEIRRVAEYVSLGSGHRWRSLVAMATAAVFSDDGHDRVMPAACAIELTHSASLLLDDLPSMDDARIRRGKPCAHLVFAPFAIDMASTFLVVLAYKLILSNKAVRVETRAEAASEITRVGMQMFHGQELDVTGHCERLSPAELADCYRLKSGALFAAAAKVAALQCDASEGDVRCMASCGTDLGMFYQHLDDLSDVIRAPDIAGKAQGMDADKTTSVDLYGIDGVKMRAERYLQQALKRLDRFGKRAEKLRGVVEMMHWKSW